MCPDGSKAGLWGCDKQFEVYIGDDGLAHTRAKNENGPSDTPRGQTGIGLQNLDDSICPDGSTKPVLGCINNPYTWTGISFQNLDRGDCFDCHLRDPNYYKVHDLPNPFAMQNLAWLGEDGQVHTVAQNENGPRMLGSTPHFALII